MAKKVSAAEDDFIDAAIADWLTSKDPLKIGKAETLLKEFLAEKLPGAKVPKMLHMVCGVPIYQHDLRIHGKLREQLVKRLQAAQPPEVKDDEPASGQPA